MKLSTIPISLFLLSGIIFPSQVNSHAGSQRACYNMKGSVERTSRKWHSGNPVPYWIGRKNGVTGGGRKKVKLKCMHSKAEKHRNHKGSMYCHTHFIADTADKFNPKAVAPEKRGTPQTKGAHWWMDAGSMKKCSKTG